VLTCLIDATINLEMASWIEAAGAIGLLLATIAVLTVLVGWAADTKKIAKAAEAQIEALKTPFVTFSTTPRDADDAVLDMDGARGTMILNFIGGNAVLINAGNGPAINIEYELKPLDGGRASPNGYVPSIPTTVGASLPIPRGILQRYRYDCVIRYSSLSGAKYETQLAIHDLVLTSVNWTRVPI
jgi:hypothetical protein